MSACLLECPWPLALLCLTNRSSADTKAGLGRSQPNPEEAKDEAETAASEEEGPTDMTLAPEAVTSADPEDKGEAAAESANEATEKTDISSDDVTSVSKPEPEVSPNPESLVEEEEQREVAAAPQIKPGEEVRGEAEDEMEDNPPRYQTGPNTQLGYGDEDDLEDEDMEPPQQPVRPHHIGMMGQGDLSPGQDHDMQPQNLHQSPHHQPQNLHQSPQNLHQSPVQMSPANMHQSPAYSGPLNLHQSPAHPGPSPTLSDHSPHPFQRPSPYHPPSESGPHNPHLQYSMSSQYPSAYNHHYFNNANNNYNGQHGFMPGHGFPPSFGGGEAGHRSAAMAEQHDMYPHQPRAHESHHSSHLGHPGLGQFPGRQGDPYSFGGASDDDGCSPNRMPGPPFNPMGFHGMPMPLIAPKPKKPRKPRKPKSPRPLPEPAMVSMQMHREDSRR